MTDLSIIIVNWNTRELLAQCLASVAGNGHTFSNQHRPISKELFVVDNASSDGSVTMVREEYPHVHLIENSKNVGFSQANNQAIVRSGGRYVLLLNSDTEVHPGALEAMVRFMDDHPDAGGCGPRLLNADGTLQILYRICHPKDCPRRNCKVPDPFFQDLKMIFGMCPLRISYCLKES